jgi:hypothetical protein
MLELVAGMVVLLLVGPLLLIGMGGLALFAAAILPDPRRRVRETFRCPVTGRVVTADFLVPEWALHPSGVVSCTFFPKSSRVTCKKVCREVAEVRWGPSRGLCPRWALISGGLVTWRSAAGSA